MGVRSRKGVNSYNSVSKNLTGSNCDQLESEAHAADDDFQSNRYSTDLSDEIESPQYLPLDFKSPSQAYLAHQYSFQSYSQSRMQLQTPIFTGINGNIRANENTFVRSQTDLYPSMSSASSTCSTYRQLCPPSTIQHSLNNLKALIANADSPIAISKCSQDSIRTEEVLLEEDIFASPEAFYSYVSKHSESESTT